MARDYLNAINSHVVVYDGGMGATLEQFELTSEDYGGLPGKCHEALVLNRPDVIEGVHALDARGRRRSRRDRHLPGLADEARGVGPRRAHASRSTAKAAEIARKAAGESRFVAGSIGPTGFLPASEDPTLGQIRFGELVEVFAEQAAGLIDGGADLLIIETAQDILEVKAAVFGAREAFKSAGRTLPIHTSVSLLPNGGKMLLGTDISAVLDDARGAERRRDRAELLDRPRGHARRDPLPRRVLPGAGRVHPERGPAAAGPRRRDDLPRAARAAGRRAEGVRRALRRRHRRRLLRHDAGAHRARSSSASAGAPVGAAPGAARRRTSPR